LVSWVPKCPSNSYELRRCTTTVSRTLLCQTVEQRTILKRKPLPVPQGFRGSNPLPRTSISEPLGSGRCNFVGAFFTCDYAQMAKLRQRFRQYVHHCLFRFTGLLELLWTFSFYCFPIQSGKNRRELPWRFILQMSALFINLLDKKT